MKSKSFITRKIDHVEPKEKVIDIVFKVPVICVILETKMYDKDGKLIELCTVHRKWDEDGKEFKVDGISIEKSH